MNKKISNLKDYLTIKQAADLIGVNPATLRRWDNEKNLYLIDIHSISIGYIK